MRRVCGHVVARVTKLRVTNFAVSVLCAKRFAVKKKRAQQKEPSVVSSMADCENGGSKVIAFEQMLLLPSQTTAMLSSKREFSVEYAKSASSACSSCGHSIKLHEFRVGTTLPSDTGEFAVARWRHFNCFQSYVRGYGGVTEVCGADSSSSFSGLSKLRAEDRKRLCTFLASDPFESSIEEAIFDTQCVALEKAKSILSSCGSLKSLLPIFLKEATGGYATPTTRAGRSLPKEDALNLIADAVVFGILPRCDVCSSANGFLDPTDLMYRCRGSIDAYTLCTYETRQLVSPRQPIAAESKLCCELPALVDCHLSGVTRVLLRDATAVKASRMDVPAKPIELLSERTIFSGIPFAEPMPNDKVRQRVLQCGGTIQASSTAVEGRPTIAIVGDKKDVDKLLKQCPTSEVVTLKWLQVCEEWRNIPHPLQLPRTENVISADFVAANPPDLGPAEKLQQLEDRNQKAKRSQARKEMESQDPTVRNSPATVRFLGSIPVDPECATRLPRPVHVVVCPQTRHPFSVSLASADVVSNTNKFYVLQLVEDPTTEEIFLFRRWGRVGDELKNDVLLKACPNQRRGIDDFKAVYFDKTGNGWDPINSKDLNFTKQGCKMELVPTAHSEETKAPNPGSNLVLTPSLLASPTRSLMTLLFDQKTLIQSMQEMSIDVEKLPVGSLRVDTLTRGRSLLAAAQKLIDETTGCGKAAPASKARAISLTNQFYSCVPHAFTASASTPDALLLNTNEKIAEKFKLLDDLSDILVTQELKTLSLASVDPALAQYESLHANLEPIEGTAEYDQVSKYLKNTHGTTHGKFELERLWKLTRQNEGQTFNPLQLSNRKLLWHGSRLTNWIRILQQGLKIAPPDAPSTGYMFGKGVYFADMFTKSANYCHFGTRNVDSGLLALAEVALGTPTIRHHSDYITQLPPGTHSCFAVGGTAPSKSLDEKWVVDENVVVPCGTQESSNFSGLLYNEFIVYNTAQIQLRYLLQVKQKK